MSGLFDLTGRTALVTGASRGLGHGMALALARAGADIAVTSRTVESLHETVAAIEALGRRAVAVELDVVQEASIVEGVAAAIAGLGRLDVLVNNAGCNVRTPSLDLAWDDWNRVLDTNLRGAFFVAQAVARDMAGRGSGRIVNIGSLTSALAAVGLPAYSASRGGIRQLTMTLAAEWAQYGITVNCLAPGWFHTAQNDVLFRDPTWVAAVTERIPAARTGVPEDLDGAVVFLASDASAYVTGHTLYVDGGAATGAFRATPAAGSPNSPES